MSFRLTNLRFFLCLFFCYEDSGGGLGCRWENLNFLFLNYHWDISIFAFFYVRVYWKRLSRNADIGEVWQWSFNIFLTVGVSSCTFLNFCVRKLRGKKENLLKRNKKKNKLLENRFNPQELIYSSFQLNSFMNILSYIFRGFLDYLGFVLIIPHFYYLLLNFYSIWFNIALLEKALIKCKNLKTLQRLFKS